MTTAQKPSATEQDLAPDQVALLRDALWQALERRDEYAADTLLTAAREQGASAESLLLDVIAPVQAKVGREWAADRITVAQEHAATAINERVIARLGGGPPAVADGRRVTVACVDGEWHALPARLLAEVLRGRGISVDFLGAQVPTPHLIAHLHRTAPDAVALSSSLPVRLPAAHAAITACQSIGVPVLAGGAAFGADGRYARLLGADFWAADARGAAEAVAQAGPRPPRNHQPIDDLPHLADQEYTYVTRNRAALVRAVYAGLERQLPMMARYTDEQRERTAEDLAHIVEFLGASLYTDDPDLLSGFLSWTADVLEARHVPAGSLLPAVDLLGAELRDFTRAGSHLAAVRTQLVRRLERPGATQVGATE